MTHASTSIFSTDEQVSTWFANARRRLKKENKLYSADRENAADDDDDDEDFNENPKEGNSSQSAGKKKLIKH